jgi:hypothetical protein
MQTDEKFDVEQAFSTAGWKRYRAPAFYPNQLFYNEEERIAAVALETSQRGGDFALKQEALQYLGEAIKQGRILEGFVVLRERGSVSALAAEAVSVVANRLAGIEPRDGKWGAYWWINQEFASPSVRLEDMPF